MCLITKRFNTNTLWENNSPRLCNFVNHLGHTFNDPGHLPPSLISSRNILQSGLRIRPNAYYIWPDNDKDTKKIPQGQWIAISMLTCYHSFNAFCTQFRGLIPHKKCELMTLFWMKICVSITLSVVFRYWHRMKLSFIKIFFGDYIIIVKVL